MDVKQSLGEPRVLISRESLLRNARLIRRTVGPRVRICAIIKADAYGHGAGVVVDTFCKYPLEGIESPAVDVLGVASIEEAAGLPETYLPVLVLRPVENAFMGRQRSRLEWAIRKGWILAVCTPSAAGDVARIAMASGRRANVQVMIDTGMSRSGVSVDALKELLVSIVSQPALRLAAVGTHFASSETAGDPFTAGQLRGFCDATGNTIVQKILSGKPVLRHTANSGGVFFWAQSHLDMVRPGLSLYGIDPAGRPCMDRALRPAMKWTAPLLMVRDIKQGQGVGYGQTWQAPHDTRVGLVPVGYADGYMRAFSNRAVMMVHGKPAPVVGRVSMDLTTIDLGQIPESTVGDEVTVLDSDPLSPASVYALAELGDTIPYEIFCRIGSRVHRVAVEPEEVLSDVDLEDAPNRR